MLQGVVGGSINEMRPGRLLQSPLQVLEFVNLERLAANKDGNVWQQNTNVMHSDAHTMGKQEPMIIKASHGSKFFTAEPRP